MKLERLHEHITTAVVTLAGMAFAIYCGKMTGQGHRSMIAIVLWGLIVATAVLTLKQRLWVLIPIMWAFPGQVPVLPLPFTVRQIVIGVVFSLSLAFIALKVVRRKAKTDYLDIILIVNLVFLVTVFIRNPVGTNATQSARIGGRPYLDIFMAFLAYLVLARASMSVLLTKRLTFFVLLGSGVQAIIGGVTYFVPALVPFIGQYYTGITSDAYEATDLRKQFRADVWRHQYLGGINVQIATFLCTWFRPLTLLNPLYLLRFACFTLLILSIFLTGFRSAMIMLGFYFLVSSYVQRGLIEVGRVIMLGLPVIALLVVLQGTFINLPLTAQRALSFLPGKWEAEAKLDATGSTQWRVEMWKIMLTSDRYIENKFLGDGFGFSRRALSIYQSGGYGADQQEFFMVTGSVHSGPISAIRYVGVVGMILYLTFIFAMAHWAFRLVRRVQGTPLFAPFFFFSMPIIYDPFGFVLVFGGLDSAYPEALLHLGMLKLMGNALDDYNSETRPAKASGAEHHRSSRIAAALPASVMTSATPRALPS